MSKVTIYDICEVNHRYFIDSPEARRNLDKIFDIPIVPRKMVEMIIEKCEMEIKWNEGCEIAASNYSAQTAKETAGIIKCYAESLLNQFEGDNNMCDNCPYKTNTCQEGLYCPMDAEQI